MHTNSRLLFLSCVILCIAYLSVTFLDSDLSFHICLFFTGLIFYFFVICKNNNHEYDLRQPWIILLIWHIPFWLVGSWFVWNDPELYYSSHSEVAVVAPHAQYLILASFTILFAGYVFGLTSDKRYEILIPKRVHWNLDNVNRIFVFLYPICIGSRIYYFITTLDCPFVDFITGGPRDLLIGNILSTGLPMFLLSVFWLIHYARPERNVTFILIVMTIFEFGWGIFYATSKFRIIYPFFAPILPYWLVKRRISMTWIAITIAVMLLIAYPYVDQIRGNYFQYGTRSYSIENAVRSYFDNNLFDTARYSKESLGRLAGLGSIIHLIDGFALGGSSLNGYSYYMSLLAIVPRYVWPDKPQIGEGRYFTLFSKGHLDVLNMQIHSVTTSTAPTLIGSIFWNFKWPGLIVHLFILGYFSALIYTHFNNSLLESPGGLLIYASYLSLFSITETEVSYLPSNFIQVVCLAYLINYLFSTKEPSEGATNRTL